MISYHLQIIFILFINYKLNIYQSFLYLIQLYSLLIILSLYSNLFPLLVIENLIFII